MTIMMENMVRAGINGNFHHSTSNMRTIRTLHVVFLLFLGTSSAWTSPMASRSRSISRKLLAKHIKDFQSHRHEHSILYSIDDGRSSTYQTSSPPHNGLKSKRQNPIKALFQLISLVLRRLLWPGLRKNFDPNIKAPLPEIGPLGCPFLGNNVLAGSQKKGPEYFYSEASAKLGHPRIWRFYFMGNPAISVSGAENVNAVLQSKRFNIASFDSWADSKSKTEKVPKKKKRAALYSSNSVMFESDRDRHKFLRRLIGVAFTPQSVKNGIANIIQSADEQIKRIQFMEKPKMEDICESFALDLAWRQIIGLDLMSEDEVQRFQNAVDTYVSGLFSISSYLNLPWKSLLPPYRARKYLVAKIMKKVALLEKNGPDGTTLSAMVFSFDEDSNNKLSHEDIVENALILLAAGTETTASTLTSAVFFLGLHPHVYEKMVQEQQQLIATHGTEITTKSLEECTYLEAVIKETMRLVPVSGLNLRTNTGDGFILDGKQVPKRASIFCNIRLTHELDPKAPFCMDPLTHFEPERWLDDATKPGDDYLPFGTGSRRCIGASLAMAEMRVFLSILARKIEKYELIGDGASTDGASTTQPNIRWNPTSIIPKPADGVPIRPTSR